MKNLVRSIFILTFLVTETSGILFGLFQRVKELEEDVKDLQEDSLIATELLVSTVERTFTVNATSRGSGIAPCGASTLPVRQKLTGGGFDCTGPAITPVISWKVLKSGPGKTDKNAWEVVILQEGNWVLTCTVYALCGHVGTP